ncbi:MAG: hypothetical protein IMX01_02695 [Limnochordaceae bacterium]|nr:hypothetical protein [Limnochordaceae bacterium]
MKGLGSQGNRWLGALVLGAAVALAAAGCASEVATTSINLTPGSLKETVVNSPKLDTLTGERTETIWIGWPDSRPKVKPGQKLTEQILQQLAALANRPPEDLARVQITLDLTADKVVKPYANSGAVLVSLTNPEYNEMAVPLGTAASGAPVSIHQTWTFDRSSMLQSVPGNWQIQLQTGELSGVQYKITVQAERAQPGSASNSGSGTGV